MPLHERIEQNIEKIFSCYVRQTETIQLCLYQTICHALLVSCQEDYSKHNQAN